MALYSMGKLAEPGEEEIKRRKPVSKSGYFSRSRTKWTEMDIAIVQHLADGHTINSTAVLLDMPIQYFQQVVMALKKLRKAKNNAHLVATAMREGVIK
jgi:hypothetical protein